MTIQDIKATISQKAGINLVALNLVRQPVSQTDDTPGEWLSHWDNDARVRVTMHADVKSKIVADLNYALLGLKQEDKPAKFAADGKTVEREAYKHFVVITPNIEVSF